MPADFIQSMHSLDSSCDPRSVIISFGVPNRQMMAFCSQSMITCVVGHDATALASGHFENASWATRTYELPFEETGNGPTTSKCQRSSGPDTSVTVGFISAFGMTESRPTCALMAGFDVRFDIFVHVF